eukprot:15441333-Alexandrium_andersonii.AAC.1
MVAERGRSLGIWEYLHGLGFTERQVFDAQGNLFDPMAVATRIADPVLCWLQGGELPAHEFPPPLQTLHLYAQARRAAIVA